MLATIGITLAGECSLREACRHALAAASEQVKTLGIDPALCENGRMPDWYRANHQTARSGSKRVRERSQLNSVSGPFPEYRHLTVMTTQ